jgi:single-strand DNA-binding protein
MVNDLNRTVLMGHIGADAAQKTSSAPVTFSVATTSRWNDNAGDRQTRTEWHNIVVFGNLAKFAIKLKKGDRVYLEGELRYSKYDKAVGTETIKITAPEIFVTQIDRVAAKADDADKDSAQDAPAIEPEPIAAKKIDRKRTK